MNPFTVPESASSFLTSFSISPSAFTLGDDLEINLTAHNRTGRRVAVYSIDFGYMREDSFAPLFHVASNVVSMENNSTGAFSHEVRPSGEAMDAFVSAMREKHDRWARMGYMLAVTLTDDQWRNTVEYCPVEQDCAIIDQRYSPEILALALERCTAAEPGRDRLALTAKIGTAQSAPEGLFKCRLYYAAGHAPDNEDECLDLTDYIGELTQGVESDATIITDAVDRAYDGFFRLEYGDGCEMATREFILPQPFQNVHESDCETGGVRFGGYSRSTPGNPLFESDFPGFFYGGLANIQSGVIPAVGVTGAGNCVDIPVTFERPFAEGTVPMVVAGFVASSTAGNFGRCCVAVLSESVTNQGFTLRFYNGDSVSRNPAYSYIALGIPAVNGKNEHRGEGTDIG